MTNDWSWLSCVSASRRVMEPFAARKRKTPAIAQPPLLPQVTLKLRQWDGPVGPWEDHFGKGRKQVYPSTGKHPIPSCMEVEVVKMLRTSYNNAFWVSCFNAEKLPARWRSYALSLAQLPAWLREIDQQIRLQITSAKGGIPDVVAWNDESPASTARFVECKAIGEDIKESQQDWVSVAIERHFVPQQFGVALRPF